VENSVLSKPATYQFVQFIVSLGGLTFSLGLQLSVSAQPLFDHFRESNIPRIRIAGLSAVVAILSVDLKQGTHKLSVGSAEERRTKDYEIPYAVIPLPTTCNGTEQSCRQHKWLESTKCFPDEADRQ
jgi:hypothetical protein